MPHMPLNCLLPSDLLPSDLRAITQLATQATRGVTCQIRHWLTPS